MILLLGLACKSGTIGETGPVSPYPTGDQESETDTESGPPDPESDGSESESGIESESETETGPRESGDTDSNGETALPEAPDFRSSGPWPVADAEGDAPVGSCTMHFVTWIPVGAPEAPWVVLSHGFQRSSANVADLARHLASWGVPVVTPDLCHASILDTDHVQNGADLVILAALLGGSTGTLYMGHSAGGLASLVAAGVDPGAGGGLGLDPVDSEDLGLSLGPAVTAPFDALIGEPSFCNTDANGEAMTGSVPDHTMFGVTDADHCDFEAPTDWLCEIACTGSNDSFSDDQIRATITGMATSWATWRSGVDPTGDQWWRAGATWHDTLVAEGAIDPR